MSVRLKANGKFGQPCAHVVEVPLPSQRNRTLPIRDKQPLFNCPRHSGRMWLEEFRQLGEYQWSANLSEQYLTAR